MTRIIAEVSIREWPQAWSALTELIDTADSQYYLTILRITGEIQFHINHQTIDNQTRHRDLSTALGELTLARKVFNNNLSLKVSIYSS